MAIIQMELQPQILAGEASMGVVISALQLVQQDGRFRIVGSDLVEPVLDVKRAHPYGLAFHHEEQAPALGVTIGHLSFDQRTTVIFSYPSVEWTIARGSICLPPPYPTFAAFRSRVSFKPARRISMAGRWNQPNTSIDLLVLCK